MPTSSSFPALCGDFFALLNYGHEKARRSGLLMQMAGAGPPGTTVTPCAITHVLQPYGLQAWLASASVAHLCRTLCAYLAKCVTKKATDTGFLRKPLGIKPAMGDADPLEGNLTSLYPSARYKTPPGGLLTNGAFSLALREGLTGFGG